MIKLLLGALGPLLTACLNFASKLIGRRTEREKVMQEEREKEIDARKKMDDAEAKSGDPVDDLRKHGF